MNLQLTQFGYNAAVDAQNNGLLLRLSQFKIGDGTGYVPSIVDTELRGNVLYTGDLIGPCEVTSESVLILNCDIPENVNVEQWSVGELAVFLDTGELFALGCFDDPYLKDPSVRLRIPAALVAPFITDVIDFSVQYTMSIPKINTYNQLPNAATAPDNSFVISQGYVSPVTGLVQPTLATRYSTEDGLGPMSWGLVNGVIYYSGLVSSVEALNFEINAPLQGIETEIALAFCAVYDGTGAGQYRPISFNPVTSKFEHPAFATPLDATSKVVIWALYGSKVSGNTFMGSFDASANELPVDAQPGHWWHITAAGVLDGVTYKVGDWLTYNLSGDWNKPWNSSNTTPGAFISASLLQLVSVDAVQPAALPRLVAGDTILVEANAILGTAKVVADKVWSDADNYIAEALTISNLLAADIGEAVGNYVLRSKVALATAAQGETADSAVQPTDLATALEDTVKPSVRDQGVVIVRGTVNADGTIANGCSGFTVVQNGDSRWLVHFDGPDGTPYVQGVPPPDLFVNAPTVTYNSLDPKTYDVELTSRLPQRIEFKVTRRDNGANGIVPFDFIAIGERAQIVP